MDMDAWLGPIIAISIVAFCGVLFIVTLLNDNSLIVRKSYTPKAAAAGGTGKATNLKDT